jgi:WD40 repeat protein
MHVCSSENLRILWKTFNNSMLVSPKWSEKACDSDVFAVRICPNTPILACALSNGQLALHSARTGRLSYTLDHSLGHFPVTSLRFNPKAPKTVLVCSADGFIREWSTHKPAINWTITEQNHQIFALDISPGCDTFASAGLDRIIRVYDYESREMKRTLHKRPGGDEGSGHTNRVFSLLWNPRDDNVLFSAGWDDSIQMWDLRADRAVHAFFGAHVCSDTLDVHDNWMLSGSWRTHDQVQLWDLRCLALDHVLRWKAEKQCLVYAARFRPGGDVIAIGGSGAAEVRFLSTKTFAEVGERLQFESTVYSLCWSKDGGELVVGTQKCECFEVRTS